MKIGFILWTFIYFTSTTGQELVADNEAQESRASYGQSGSDVFQAGSKPEAYFLHFKPHPSDYYRKQPSKFLLLLRLPEEDRAEGAQKIAQVLEGAGGQQQKFDDVGFEDDGQQRIKSVLQSKLEDSVIEQQRAAGWIPADSGKSYGGSTVEVGTKASLLDSGVTQSSYGAISAAKSGVGGYKLSVGQGVRSKSALGGYGASGSLGSAVFGGVKGGFDLRRPDFGTKGSSLGGSSGFGFGGVSAVSGGGYGGSAGIAATGVGGGYGGVSDADDGFDSSSAVGGGGSGGYGSGVSSGVSGFGDAVVAAVKGGPSVKKVSFGGAVSGLRAPVDFSQKTLTKVVQAAIKGGGDVKSSFGDYGQKQSVTTQISSPVFTDMSSLGLGLSGDLSPKQVYFANKEAVLSSPRCKCDMSDSQGILTTEGYQRAESHPGSVNVASISDAETKEDVSGYTDEAPVSDEGKIPVIFIGLPKKKYA